MRWLLILLAWSILVAGVRAETPATHTVRLNGHVFTLPQGFTIELVAGPPLVSRPIVADFDEQGRLYVADSSGSNEKVDVQLQKKPHRILRLEDRAGTGRFDRATVFADQMMFPEGVMCRGGSVYVAAPPSIWKLTDTTGAGVADQRVEWFQGKTLTGCANDLHGPYAGPDGWIYWCKGAFARQTYERPGKAPFVTRAAHIFRCRPDGSGIEAVMTGGMDNPVDVVFTPGGERIFTTTFLQHPGGGRRDGLIHAVYGGVYGKDHDVVTEHPWTAPALMPVLTHMGPAAPCGLTRYESDVFGAEYRDNLFAAQFNLRKVSRHILEADGATFRTRDEDFLVSDNFDFHPTDVIEDADGSLLVIDTGGWYKLCCPTSQLPKPDVLGAIYRIRRQGVAGPADPRGLKLEWARASVAELAGRLSDARPTVRRRAVEVLASRGEAALPELAKVLTSGTVEARRQVVWTATRIEAAAARALVRQALADSDETVRQTALHSISLLRDREAAPALRKLLTSPALHNRRAAAEALGRLGDRAAVPDLLTAVGDARDRFLQHALTYALIEIADRESTRVGLSSANPLIRRAALIALDQMTDGQLDVGTVAVDLTSTNPLLEETATWIVGRHPEWGGYLADQLGSRLKVANLPPADSVKVVGLLARFAATPAIQQLLAASVRDVQVVPEVRRRALRAMAGARLKTIPEVWMTALTEVLHTGDAETVREAVAAARALPAPKQQAEGFVRALLRVGQETNYADLLRLNALAAVSPGLSEVKPEVFSFLVARLPQEQPVVSRSLVADVLSRAQLSSEQLLALAGVLKTTGPMEGQRLLEAFTRTTDEKVGLALVAALSDPDVRIGLRSEMLKQRLEKYPETVKKAAAPLYARLDGDLTRQRAQLDALVPLVKEGDVRRGQAVFNSPKAACAACHTIGYVGGKVGPDLTHIGKIRSERDLLESILFPSASFVRSYEPVLVLTKKGRTFNGVLRKDAPDEVVLALNATEEVRIAREDIDEMTPGTVSIMPAGLDQQLTPAELADLVAFLKACQ